MMLEYIIGFLLGGLCVLIVLDERSSSTLVRAISLLVPSIVLLLSLKLLSQFNSFDGAFQEILTYNIGFGRVLSFGLDGISIFFFILSNFLIMLCVVFIWDEKNFKEYCIYLLLIDLFLLIIFMSLDLLFFYVFFEAILVPMFLMIGIWGSRERKVRAVYLFFFYTLCSSLLMLIGILYIYNIAGSLNLEYLVCVNFSMAEQTFLWFAFFLSFASKIPMFPFHIWLPEAHVEAPTVGSVLLAGILLKLGVYGFLRFSLTLFVEASHFFTPIIYFLCVIGVLYASLTAVRQTDLKRIIAYSSVAHMNLVTLGIFAFNVMGTEGSILQSVSHGFVSGGLFLLVGILYNRYHSRFVYFYGGLVHFMPLYATVFLLLTFANIALPGTSSFIGEFLLLAGVYLSNAAVAIVAALGVILCGGYSLWLYNKVIYGNVKVSYTQIYADLNWRELSIMLPLILLVLLLGMIPGVFIEYLHSSCNSLYLIGF